MNSLPKKKLIFLIFKKLQQNKISCNNVFLFNVNRNFI